MDKSGSSSEDDSRRKSESDDFPHQVRDKLLQVQAAENPITTPFRARSRSGSSKAAFKESDTETYHPSSSSSMLKPSEKEGRFTVPCSRVPSTDSVTSSPYPTITTHDVYPPPKVPRNTRSLASVSPKSQGSSVTGSSWGSPYPTSRSSSSRTLNDIPSSILDSSSTRSSFDAGASSSQSQWSLPSQPLLTSLPPSGRLGRIEEKRKTLKSSRSLQEDDEKTNEG